MPRLPTSTQVPNDKRQPGISVLIPTLDEEAVVAGCILSFLNFGDELIVVDNGSTDGTKDIVRDLAAKHPEKIRFFDKPELPDLYQNRQFALSQSRFQWLVRADSDYICYDNGEFDIGKLREFLLSRSRTLRPLAVSVPQTNIVGDYWHTGVPMRPGGWRANPERQHVSEGMIPPMVRFYRWFPGFAFVRRKRRETARFRRLMKVIHWPTPVWMHCNIKSDMNHFFRSERPDWRQLGDFGKFPSLQSYIESIVEDKYGTRDLDEAAALYMQRSVLPWLEPYDEKKFGPYPTLVRELMRTNPVYRIGERNGQPVRDRVPSN